MDYSVTQAGNFVAVAGIIVVLLSKLGIAASVEEVATVIGGAVALVGTVISWVGRYRQGDVTPLGFKKPVGKKG